MRAPTAGEVRRVFFLPVLAAGLDSARRRPCPRFSGTPLPLRWPVVNESTRPPAAQQVSTKEQISAALEKLP